MSHHHNKLQKLPAWASKQFQKHLRHNKHFATPGPHDFRIILDHPKPSFNIGKIFRSAEVFGGAGLDIIGLEEFDLRPAKGAFKYVPARFHNDFASCYADLTEEQYTLFILDPTAPAPLHKQQLAQKCGFIFGHEEYGFSFEKEDYPDIVPLRIPQFGKIESMNVSIAASIVMYEYISQHSEAE